MRRTELLSLLKCGRSQQAHARSVLLRMTLLTPYEYDQLPDDVKAALAGIARQPQNDVKSDSYRRRFGKFRNGDLSGDARVQQQVGYGTGSPLASHTNPNA